MPDVWEEMRSLGYHKGSWFRRARMDREVSLTQFCDEMNRLNPRLSFNPPMVSRIERGIEIPDDRHGRAMTEWALQTLPGMPGPVARTTDPDTSHEAAESVAEFTIEGIRLWWLEHLNPYRNQDMMQARLWNVPDTEQEYVGYHCTDQGAWRKYQQVGPIPCSESGFRTRRSELVHMGLVVDSGARIPLASGRKAIAWRITETGTELVDAARTGP